VLVYVDSLCDYIVFRVVLRLVEPEGYLVTSYRNRFFLDICLQKPFKEISIVYTLYHTLNFLSSILILQGFDWVGASCTFSWNIHHYETQKYREYYCTSKK